MRFFLAALFLLGGLAGEAKASQTCPSPEGMLKPGIQLPGLAKQLKNVDEARILIYGTASITGAGIGKPGASFPEQFAGFLKKNFPASRINVLIRSRQGETASQMVENMQASVLSEKPHLVIWQTGSVDVVKGVDINAFGGSLEKGLDILQQAGIEVALIDQQYNPHIAPLNNVEEYQDYMEGIAKGRNVLLFPRFELMRYWATSGHFPFDETAPADRRKIAAAVHACIGQLLSEMVSEALSSRH
jgi:hypothetical protein